MARCFGRGRRLVDLEARSARPYPIRISSHTQIGSEINIDTPPLFRAGFVCMYKKTMDAVAGGKEQKAMSPSLPSVPTIL